LALSQANIITHLRTYSHDYIKTASVKLLAKQISKLSNQTL